MTNETIKDDVYVEIDNEFEQIRTSLGMYISKLGTEGALHLVKEITNNEFDEAVNPMALNTEFTVIFDEIEQSYSTIDKSRGIPFDKMVGVCMKKHTSTKFTRDDEKMKDQAGRNGVGLVVTAACSTYFSMTSYRGNESKTIEIIDGELKEHKPVKLKKEQHGLAVKFIPSEKYLKGEVNMQSHQIGDYLRKMSYIMRNDIKIDYYEFAKDMNKKDYEKGTPSSHIKYKRQGLSENVKYLSQNLEFTPVEIASITEDFDLEVAFSYDKTIDETIVNSYCNYINTTEGGYHETVAQRAICDFFCREAKKLDPNAKYEVTFEDCKKGLIYCVNCRHKDPAFEGQHKSRVSNEDVLKEGKKGLTNELYKYFNANNALLRRIIAYLRTISKVRLEAHKIKGVTTKKQTTFIDDSVIPMYYPLANRNYSGYKELIIAEGDSAAVAIDSARNSMHQAVFGVMGVVSNVHGMTVVQVMTKCKVFANLVEVLGCGIGKDFDITKLKYDKIIIEADADTDGSNITSLVLLFFVLFLPELILQGKVYKSLPPLLVLNEKSVRRWYKGSVYLYSREDYYDVINKIISSNSEIAIKPDMHSKNVIPLGTKNYMKWLKMNAEYTTELNRLQARAASNPLIIEFVCYAKLVCGTDKDECQFKDMIEEKFPEIDYDIATQTLRGSLHGESITLIADGIFWKAARKFMRILAENESIFILVKNKNDSTDRYNEYTIGEFLYEMENTYTIKIQQRYKGIGEMDAEVIFATTLNPKIRRLIRFNMDNAKETIEIFNLLHAKTAEMRQQRRDLLDNSEINYMDLDN